MEEYVDFVRVPDRADQDTMTFWADLRPRTLNYWLRNMQIKSSDGEHQAPLNKFSAKRDGGRSGKEIVKAAS
jgi:hypothetical protein